jgi:periplasmic divalent cation tolerance protein
MREEQPEPIIVFITAGDKDEAARLAEALVEARLAACVQILPGVQSTYRWQGQLERQEEVLLIAKTLRSKFGELEREVRARHSYETPEIVAAPLTLASGPYLEWLIAGVTAEG